MTRAAHGGFLLVSAALLAVAFFAESLAAAAHHVQLSSLSGHAGPRVTAGLFLWLSVVLSMIPVIRADVGEWRRPRVALAVLLTALMIGLLLAGWTFSAACASLIVSGICWLQRRKRMAVDRID